MQRVLAALAALASTAAAQDFNDWEWVEVNGDAEWMRRAGHQAAELDGRLYVLGGRTSLDSSGLPFPIPLSYIWGDVWRSDDGGESWTRLLSGFPLGRWAPRAFHQVLTKGHFMYVLGGQNYKPLLGSDFFNDVWRSFDGIHWQRMTKHAAWGPRAGHSAAVLDGVMYVLAGSINDDESIIIGPPERIYFDDVYKSWDNGRTWHQAIEHAPWEPRAGARVAVKDGYLWLFGGEAGFLCEPVPCDPPYFNDVWRTANGHDWELVTPAADWPARPGHEVAVVEDHFVLFGGFGLSQDPTDPFAPSNPVDVWVSPDGATWTMLDDGPWNATMPEEVKYDFDALVIDSALHGPSIYTFGGDRETFDYQDPDNYLRMDNDVWRFSMAP